MQITFDELAELIKEKATAYDKGYDEGYDEAVDDTKNQCKLCDRIQKVSWEEVEKEWTKWICSYRHDNISDIDEVARWVYNFIFKTNNSTEGKSFENSSKP